MRAIMRDSGNDFAAMPAPGDRSDPMADEVIASAAAEVVRLWEPAPSRAVQRL